MSKDIASTIRSSPAANFEWNQAVFANNPSLSFSNFDLRHKFVSSHYYNFDIGKNSTGFISFLYNGRAGTTFSYVYQGDLNRDGSSRNDVIINALGNFWVTIYIYRSKNVSFYAD